MANVFSRLVTDRWLLEFGKNEATKGYTLDEEQRWSSSTRNYNMDVFSTMLF